jgi:hypothetical protein
MMRLRFLTTFSGQIISLERELPDLVGLLKPRSEQSEWRLTDDEWQVIADIVKNTPKVTHEELTGKSVQTRVVLGDSHSVARYRGGSLVLRNDGLTLHGLLQRGIGNMLDEAGIETCETLVIQAGNIDIRHHLMRQPNPEDATVKLVKDLGKQLSELKRDGRILDYQVTCPYPIEFEGRKLPKTGFYKGTPFFGSRLEREELRKLMTRMMVGEFKSTKLWPVEWFKMDPEKYAETFMEKPRSVHLSPAHYEWDLEKNIAR